MVYNYDVLSEGMKEKAQKRIAVQLVGLTRREYLELKAEATMAEAPSLGAYVTKLIRGRKSARVKREQLK